MMAVMFDRQYKTMWVVLHPGHPYSLTQITATTINPLEDP
jgi:hypothetical protein